MKRFLASVLAAAIATPALAANPWHETGAQGHTHFVVVDKASIKNQDVYRLAVGALCRTRVCQVFFWATDAQAANRLPMTDAQVASRVAIFKMNRNADFRLMQWRCDIEPGPDCL